MHPSFDAHVEQYEAYLMRHPCVDCGERDSVVLEFDHVPDRASKSAGVGELVRRRARWAELRDEIRKCDVVCANCHRRRTAKRSGWRRLVTSVDQEACPGCALCSIGGIEGPQVQQS